MNNKDKQIVTQITTAQKVAKKAVQVGLDEYTRNRIVHMAMMGLSNRAIQKNLSVTLNQIYKAQKWAGITKIAYRDAVSPIGRAVVRRLNEITENKIARHLERLLLK